MVGLTPQRFDDGLVLQHYARRQSSVLPVVNELLESGLAVEPKQLRERGVTAGCLNDSSRLVLIHASHRKRGVDILSNATWTTRVNAMFRMRAMRATPIDKLLSIIEARGLSDADAAERIGLPRRQNLNNWKLRGIPHAQHAAVAKFIGCTVDELLELPVTEMLRRESAGDYTSGRRRLTMVLSDQKHRLAGGRIPVVGTAQLGDGGYWAELEHPVGAGDGYIDLPSRDPNAYAVRVVGDSMEPGIRSGHFVLCAPNAPCKPGDDVLVRTKDGRSMVKRYLYEREGAIVLESVNTEFGRITLAPDQIEVMHYVSGTVSKLHWLPE